MFVVNDMPKQIDGSLVELLEQAETATIGHVLYEGFVDRGIAPLLPRRRVAGTAVTLRLPHCRFRRCCTSLQAGTAQATSC